MKRIFAGTAFLFFGLILYLGVRIQAVEYMPSVNSWPTDKGRYWAALAETNGLTPTYMAIIFCLFGITFILWGSFEDTIRNKFIKDLI